MRAWSAAAAAVVLLGGCATTQRPDPLEPVNRKVFGFNEAVDRAVLKPVATRYVEHVPEYVRTSLSNFFGNLRDVWSAANLFLQGRPKDGLDEVLRVSVNTVFGAAGFMDVATPMGLNAHREDLGQTLGHWGAAPGAYLVLPLLGPSSLRDATDVPAGWYVQPQGFIDDGTTRGVLTGLNVVGRRADALPATRMLDEIALDRYIFTRDAYLQRRQALIDRDREAADEDDAYPAAPDEGEPTDATDSPAAPPSPPKPAAPVGPQSQLQDAGRPPGSHGSFGLNEAGRLRQGVQAAGAVATVHRDPAWPGGRLSQAGGPDEAPITGLIPGPITGPIASVITGAPTGTSSRLPGGCATGRCLAAASL